MTETIGIATVFRLLLATGVYTACRTLNRWSVVDIDAHLDRLTLIEGLEPSKSQSVSGHTFYCASRSSPSSPPTIVSASSANLDPTSAPGTSNLPSSHTTDKNAHNSSAAVALLPWKLCRETMRSVAYPILRKLIEMFDTFDGGALSELRMTVLVAHRWEDGTSDRTWRGAKLLHHTSQGVQQPGQPSNAPQSTNASGGPSTSSDSPVNLTKEEKKRLERELFLQLYDVWVFGEYMPDVPMAPILMDLITAERHNPTVKHVDWTTERKKLEAEGTEGANEVVLMDARGRIAEGLSSNFLAVVRKEPRFLLASDQMTHDMSATASWDDAEAVIMTAPDHAVLAGTIRHLMLQCASENNIPVVFDFPTSAQLENGQWLSCAIMSTSRLLLPVTQVNVLATGSSNPSSPRDAAQRPPLSASVELLPPLPTKLKSTSSHVIAQSYRFPSDHPLLDRLVTAIRAKMKDSSAYLKS